MFVGTNRVGLMQEEWIDEDGIFDLGLALVDDKAV